MKRLFLAVGASLALTAPNVFAQCPDFGFAGGEGWNGDEPAAFTHYVDHDRDGSCDLNDANVLIVAFDAANGVYENGFYPDCDITGDGQISEAGGDQIGHGHWEYTRLHTDPNDQGKANPETEEKDYFTLPQSMQEDFENQDPQGNASRHSFGQTQRFLLNEPVRFDRFVRHRANPSGRYWQVDEWIGPATSEGEIRGGSWNERFFTCGSQEELPSPCVEIDGRPAYGAYWSDHAQRFGQIDDCGDPLLAYPPADREAFCGTLFAECSP